MCGNKTYTTNISKSALNTLKGTTSLCRDVLNAYLNLVKQQRILKVFTADTYVFTAFSNDKKKTFLQEIKLTFLILILYLFLYI